MRGASCGDMPHTALTTYRVMQRCTVRSAPDGRAQQLARLDPPKDVRGWEQTPGWVEWVSEEGDNDVIMGYIKIGTRRALVPQ